MRSKQVSAVASLLVLVAAGCGGDGEEKADTTPSKPAEKTSKAITFDQLSRVKLGTPRTGVLARFGPPIEKEDSKPSGVAVNCYRYYAVDPSGTRIDKRVEFRICYDKRDRLSLKATAPPPRTDKPAK